MNEKDWQEHVAPLLAAGRLGVVTDVDGTISPLVGDPDAAAVTPEALAALQELRERLPLVACVSGRAAVDIAQRVGLPGLVYVGNHGFERWEAGRLVQHPAVTAARPRLVEAAAALAERYAGSGAQVEDKGATLTLHYRNAADPAGFVARESDFIEQLAGRLDLHLSRGNHVYEFRPPAAIDKGSALSELAAEFALDGVIFLGDDVTDVDGFRAVQALRESGRSAGLAVGVDGQETPDVVRATSDMMVSGVAGVESFLSRLAIALSASAT